jgi:hypothetical protein
MAKNIEPSLKLISKYLQLEKDESFIIPEYQRGYSWDLDRCDKLWQDIETFIASGATDPYFFGTIIVDCSDSRSFSLIDGQQRTTTFLLLLKALLIKLNESIERVSVNKDTESLLAALTGKRNKIMFILYKAEDGEIPIILSNNNFVDNVKIIENNSINELFPEELEKIIKAADFESVEKVVHKISKKRGDNKYTKHYKNFKFFYEKLDEISESNLDNFSKVLLEKCQIIEIRSWQIEQAITMFNSLNSSGLPLSDADIISAQLYSRANADRVEFNEMWGRILSLTEELNMHKVADINSVLQQFMYISRANNKVYMNGSAVDVTTPGLRRYYTDLNKDILKNPLSLCRDLEKIALIWHKVKNYPLVKLLLKSNENTKLYLIGYLFRFNLDEVSEDKVGEMCLCLLRLFTMLELVDAGYSSAKFKTFLFGQNINIVDKNISINDISQNFDDHIKKSWRREDVFNLVLECEKNYLVYLNEYLYSVKEGHEFDFSENVNIEHIMPASGRNIEAIRVDADLSDREEFNEFANKIGNKILLEERINKSIGNEWFRSKKQKTVAEKAGYKDSRFALALSLSNYPGSEWRRDEIDANSKKAADRIVKFIFNDQ